MTITDVGDELAGPGIGLEISARLSASLDRTSDALERHRRQLERAPMLPVYARLAASGVANSDGDVVLDLGGPVSGHAWYVRNLVVGGLTADTTAAGVADVYVSGATVPLAGLSLVDWRDRADSLPLIAFYGRGEVTLQNDERLVLRFSGATSAQTYVVGATIEDYQLAAVAQEWGL